MRSKISARGPERQRRRDPHGHRHEVPVAGNIDELASVAAPARHPRSGGGDATPLAGTRVGHHIDLGPAGFVRVERQEPAVGREPDLPFPEGRPENGRRLARPPDRHRPDVERGFRGPLDVDESAPVGREVLADLEGHGRGGERLFVAADEVHPVEPRLPLPRGREGDARSARELERRDLGVRRRRDARLDAALEVVRPDVQGPEARLPPVVLDPPPVGRHREIEVVARGADRSERTARTVEPDEAADGVARTDRPPFPRATRRTRRDRSNRSRSRDRRPEMGRPRAARFASRIPAREGRPLARRRGNPAPRTGRSRRRKGSTSGPRPARTNMIRPLLSRSFAK